MEHPTLISLLALAIFSVAAVAVHRVWQERVVWWWFAWAGLVVAGLASSLGVRLGPFPVALAFSPMFASFILAGSLQRCGRPVPRWWMSATLSYCILRSFVGGLGPAGGAHALTLTFEVPALIASAFCLARVPIDNRGALTGLFPYMAGLLVITRIVDSMADLVSETAPPYELWLISGVPFAVLQIADALDLSGRKARRASNALDENLRRFDAIAEGADELILESTLDGIFVYASPSARAVLGRDPEDLRGSAVVDLVHPDQVEDIRSLGRGGTYKRPIRMRHADGSWRWLEGSARAYTTSNGEERLVAVHRDVTDRIDSEERVRESQKLESLGLLAGGIAHDFNNLLAPILGNAALAREMADADAELPGILQDLEEGAIRAAELTQQLLEYVGRRHREVTQVSLSEVAGDVLRMFESTLPSNVKLTAKLPDDLPAVLADSNQIRQIVMNLLTNATDAIGSKEGTISLHTDVLDADAAYLAQTELGGSLWPGKFGYLEMRDDGVGMEAEERSRIFDPFYTTKPHGRGLGLAVLLGIVRSHHGAVDVKTTPGYGTMIRVLLPLAPAHALAEAPTTEEVTEHWGRGTVLIADDEPLVRNLAARILERAGYRCLLAADGLTALDTLKGHSDEVVAVLLDITMPELRGDEAFLKIRECHPDLPVIFSSGYPAEALLDRLPDDDAVEFVGKPYRPGELTGALGRLIGDA